MSQSSGDGGTPLSTSSDSVTSDSSAPASDKQAKTSESSAASSTGRKQNAIWTSADDATLVSALKQARKDGHQAENGWKQAAWNAVARALAGGRGGEKTPRGCRDHWRSPMVTDFNTVRWLRYEASGFGWDDVTKTATATPEVWEVAIASHKNVAKFRGRGFPLYDDIADLLQGRQATGKGTVRVPQSEAAQGPTSQPNGVQTETETEKELAPPPPQTVEDGEAREVDFTFTYSRSASPHTPVRGRSPAASPVDAPPVSSQKRRRSASGSPIHASASASRARLTGPIAVHKMANAVSEVASSLAVSARDLATPTRRQKAVGMVADDKTLSQEVRLSAMSLFTKDIAMCDSYLAIKDPELRNKFLLVQLEGTA